MSSSGSLDTENLVKLALASRGQGDFFEDAAEFDDDETWEFDDDDESFGETDIGEARRRRRRSRRSFRRPRFKSFGRRSRPLSRAKGSRTTTLRAKNGQRMQVRFGKSFATTAELNKLIKSTESRFAAAMKERKANHEALSKRIATATRNLDEKVATLRKHITKLEKQSQTSMLLGMLQGPPKVEKLRLTSDNAEGLKDKDITAEVTFKKSDMLLPLMAMGGLGGSGKSDDTLMLALLLSKDK